MNLYKDLIDKKTKLSVVGLGYVGLVLAIELAKRLEVIGFDINDKKIYNYLNGIDPTQEVGSDGLKATTMQFTTNEKDLQQAKFHIIAVPTPINSDRSPDLRPLISASKIVGRNLKKGSIVVYESTVFPGATETLCVPVLEKESGLRCGLDFKVGYSPERVNPGDKIHTVDKIVKIVSGMDNDCLEIIAHVYELVIKAGVFRAKSIQVAEAAKVIENAQRDINIAFINELALIFDKMGLDTLEVLEAAATKWNFTQLYPGLVGGHCISVDPYYLIDFSKKLGYTPKLMSVSRKINESISDYIAEKTIRLLIAASKQVKGANVAILGFTFKENCPDIRNTKVTGIIDKLKEYQINCFIMDPLADSTEVKSEYNIELVPFETIKNMDAIIIAVAHDAFKVLSPKSLKDLYAQESLSVSSAPVLIDVKGIFDKQEVLDLGYLYWRL